MPQLVVVGSPSLWPRGWKLDPFEVQLVSDTAGLKCSELVDCVVIAARTVEQAVIAGRAVDDFRGESAIAKVLATDARMPMLERLLRDYEFDGCIDLTWPDTLVRSVLAIALRHIELGRNVVEIQRTVLALSRDEAAGLRDLVGHDDLTHLHNRRYFSAAVAREHDRSQRMAHPYALVFIDLDDLKSLNNRWGHEGGSTALRELASLLRTSVRASDLAARMGGDEFVVFLDNCDEAGALEFANRFCQRVKEHVFEVDGKPASISVSAGVAVYPQHGRQYLDLLRRADTALYEAKSQGKGRAVAFDVKHRLAPDRPPNAASRL